jgi:hypothetical protein
MISNKTVTAILSIEKNEELKNLERQFIIEERYISRHKKRKWLGLFLNTFLAFYISSLICDITSDIKNAIITSIFASVFSFIMQEVDNLRFMKFIKKRKLNINLDTFKSNTTEQFKNKISDIVDKEMKKERISNFKVHLESVRSTPEVYQMEIVYSLEE